MRERQAVQGDNGKRQEKTQRAERAETVNFLIMFLIAGVLPVLVWLLYGLLRMMFG